MTTINNSNPQPVLVESSDSSGWVVSVILLLAIIGGGAFAWMRYHRGGVQQGPTINVTIPSPNPSPTQ